MEVVFIKAKWDKPKNKYLKQNLRYRPSGAIDVIKSLEYKDGMYIAKEYSRCDGKYIVIGIESQLELESVYAIGKFGYKRELVEIKKGIWIPCSEYIWDESKKEYELLSPPIGINQCGTIRFQGILKNGKIVMSDEVKIISSLLTEEEYKIMQDEICTISENLLSNVNLGDGNSKLKALINIELLQKNVNELKYLLNRVENSPQEQLLQIKSKVKIEKIRKLNARSLIEQEMYPFKDKLYATNIISTYDIKEHRMIKSSIVDFLEVCERQIKYEEGIYNTLSKKIEDIESKKYLLEDNSIRKNVEENKNYLNKENIILNSRKDKWKKVKLDLENMIYIGLFENIGYEELEQTHIFNFNPLYRDVYDSLKNISKSLSKEEQLSLFQKDLVKSPYLYEKWVWFKVLEYLIETMKFYYEGENLVKIIIDYYNKNNSLRGLEIKLKNRSGKYAIVTSERRIRSESNMYPDISLQFIDGTIIKEIFLDAKYKEYSVNDNSKKILCRDIIGSAIRYKENSKICRGAFLVHPDKKLPNNYEYEISKSNSRPHEFGYFLLTPNNQEGLHTIFKLIIHFYLEWSSICPDCGSIECMEKPYSNKGGVFKHHYTCKHCKAFWVQSKCWNDNIHTKIKLYKYFIENFHKESGSKWDVYCPICGKSYEDYKNRNSKYI